MSIYLNSVKNNLFVELEDSSEATIEVFNENGQVLIQKTITNSQNSVNTNHISTGIYWVKLTSNKGIITKKIFKN